MTRALLALRYVEEAESAIDAGLALDTEGEPGVFVPMQKKLQELRASIRMEEMKRQSEVERKSATAITMGKAIEERKLTVVRSQDPCSPSSRFSIPDSFSYRVQQDPQDHSLSWPVVLVYPELEHFDVIAAWNENVRLREMLEEVLADRDFDASHGGHQYTKDSVAVYQWSPKDQTWKRVRLLGTLREAMGDCVDADMVIRLWVTPKPEGSAAGNQWTRTWLQGQ